MKLKDGKAPGDDGITGVFEECGYVRFQYH